MESIFRLNIYVGFHVGFHVARHVGLLKTPSNHPPASWSWLNANFRKLNFESGKALLGLGITYKRMPYYIDYASEEGEEEDDGKPAALEEVEEKEDLSSSDKESDWDSSSDEESDWDSFNPAKFLVGGLWVNQPERIQQPRQANKNQKVEYITKNKYIALGKKKCCLGGTQ